MASILTLENVSRDFDGTPLFTDVTFGIQEGERVGLIGRNGTGKTTLLRMINGNEKPDSGRIYTSGTPVIGYLPQNPEIDPAASVLDTIFASNDQRITLIRDYEEVCALLAGDGSSEEEQTALLERLNELSGKMDATDAWSLETEARIILDRLGITDTGAPIRSLSGGQRKRVAMAHALLEKPDLLILDEPTNHLDAETIDWLEDFLIRSFKGALLLVTHDRYFLENVAGRIVEIDRGGTINYAGNYSYYLQKKAEDEARREVEEHKLSMLAKQELAWLRSGAKARRTKQKARIERADELLNRKVEGPAGQVDISVNARRLGTKTLELHGLSKSYGETTLLEDFTWTMKPDERVGVIGPNGSGKTTLLEMIVGRVEPDKGRIEKGETVVIGYYDQESRALAEEMRIIDYVKEGAEIVKTADGGSVTASQMLERFLFAPKSHYNLIGNLSGGERRRLFLLRLLMSSPNILILDEPTNDLDIATLQALENYLVDFPGPVIIVSHDRYFLDRTIDHVFRFEGEGRIRDYPGDYSAFLEIRERERAEREAIETAEKEKMARERVENAEREKAGKKKKPVEKRGLSYREEQELARLEGAIAEAEEKKSEIEAELLKVDYQRAGELAEEIRAIEEGMERDMERWAELEEVRMTSDE